MSRQKRDNAPSHEAMRQRLAAEAKMMAAKGYLTPHEAARQSGRGLATIYRWLRPSVGHKGKPGPTTLEGKTTGQGAVRHWVTKKSLRSLVRAMGTGPATTRDGKKSTAKAVSKLRRAVLRETWK